jgi:hypothetical protein
MPLSVTYLPRALSSPRINLISFLFDEEWFANIM